MLDLANFKEEKGGGKVQLYNKKVIVSGNVVEVYEYEEPVAYDYKERTPRSISPREPDEPGPDGKGIKRVGNIMRTRNNLRRLILSNFSNNSRFITLTFAENVTDIERANQEFKRFIQRLRRWTKREKRKDFRYIAVIEFQKRGAIHYHVIMDIGFVRQKDLQEIWGQGFIKINRIRHVDNIGAYVTKYMTKDLYDERLSGKKAYLASRNLKRPIELKGESAEKLIEAYELEKRKTVYSKSYDSEYNGLVNYREYNLNR